MWITEEQKRMKKTDAKMMILDIVNFLGKIQKRTFIDDHYRMTGEDTNYLGIRDQEVVYILHRFGKT